MIAHEYRVNWLNVVGVMGRACMNMAIYAMHLGILYYSNLANTSFSLIISIYSFSSFLTFIAFRVVFKERVLIQEASGMALILLFAVI